MVRCVCQVQRADGAGGTPGRECERCKSFFEFFSPVDKPSRLSGLDKYAPLPDEDEDEVRLRLVQQRP